MRFFHRLPLFGAFAGALLTGCGQSAAPPQSAPQTQTSTQSSASPGAPSGAPMMGAAQKLTVTPALDAQIAQLASGGNKKALAAALTARGDAKMNDAAAPPRLKYRAALADYDRALKIDPKNRRALEAKATIENIYKMMGRPVPTS